MMQDQNTQDGSESQPEEVICIAKMSDGTYSVYVEGDQDAQASDQEPTPSSPQSAQSSDEALAMAKQLLGAEDQEDASEPSDGTDDSATMPPDQAASAWKQMAAKKNKSMGM